MVAAWLQANAIAKAAARIGDAINGLNEVLRSNHPPQGETLEQALDTISDALKRRTRG
jgi:predicted RNase H-like HicB family nuclease